MLFCCLWMRLANKAPLPPPRKESFRKARVTNHENEINLQAVTAGPAKHHPTDTAYYTSETSVQEKMTSQISNTSVSYAQKIIKPLTSVSSADTSTVAGISTTLHQGQRQQSQKRKISTLKLTRTRDPASSIPCHSQQQLKPVEEPVFSQRPMSPACNPMPEIHTASLSVQIVPTPDNKAEPEIQDHPPSISPDTSKMSSKDLGQKSTVLPSSQAAECHVVYLIFPSFILDLHESLNNHLFSYTYITKVRSCVFWVKLPVTWIKTEMNKN